MCKAIYRFIIKLITAVSHYIIVNFINQKRFAFGTILKVHKGIFGFFKTIITPACKAEKQT